MAKKFYITTPIYYPSGNFHIGNAYTTVIADCIKRYKVNKGYDVFFLTGTDEHGEKIATKATEAGVTPQEYVDDIVSRAKKLWSELGINYDDFIRTTDERHVKVAQDVFSKFLNQDDIYKSSYKGLYCKSCEAYWTPTQVGEHNECPDCGKETEVKEEEAYFFRMNKYAPWLIEYYKDHPDFVVPHARINEMLNNFLLPGLNDLCVSRTSISWGIPVKEDPKHVIYVWIDALTNYISALGYGSDNPERFKKYWEDEDCEVVHLMSKEIIRFHTIYWPIMLKQLGLRLPSRIYSHGWVLMKGGKMSKSVGNVVYPGYLINKYGVDTLRYYMTKVVPFGQDGTFTPEMFIENVNTDLVNNIGNLLSRTVAMIIKYFDGVVPSIVSDKLNDIDNTLVNSINELLDKFESNMDEMKLTEGITTIFEIGNLANKYIDDKTPWVLAKDETRRDELANCMNLLAESLRKIAILFTSFLVETPAKMFAQLGVSQESQAYSTLKQNLSAGNNVVKLEALFTRLDVEKESAYIDEKMKEGKPY